jgi:hypothetical protein
VSTPSAAARASGAGRHRTLAGRPCAIVTGFVVAVATVAVGAGATFGAGAPASAAVVVGARDDSARSKTGSAAPHDERLPDLDQEAPSELELRVDTNRGHPSYRLGFRSAVRNVGAGPLIVTGTRADAGSATMTVNQLVQRTSGPPRAIAGVGEMEYAVSPSHSHWHYLQFDRYQLQSYELRDGTSNRVLVADRKTGFCLGDRYRATGVTRLETPTAPVFTGGCGLMQPELLQMVEGISVGYGDDYSGFLEGQDLPLDGLADGRYLLVHRVNAGRSLRELSYANDAASVLLRLRWVDGQPRLRALASCPDSERCEVGDDAATGSPGTEIPFSSGPAT